MDGGGALRNGQNIYGLSQLGELDVLYIGPTADINPLPCMRMCEVFAIDASLQRAHGFVQKILLNLKIFFGGYYPQFAGYYLREVVDWINRKAAQGASYDYIVVEELALAYYIPYLGRIGRVIVFDAHNVEGVLRNQMESGGAGLARYIGLDTLKRTMLRRNLEKLERQAVRGATLVWACSELDRELLLETYGVHIKCFVVPNTIKVDGYTYSDRTPEVADWTALPLAVVYMGTYSYRPNSDAAMVLMTEIMPLLRLQHTRVKLYLVGRSPTPAMVTYAKDHGDIVITGSVESVEPYLKMACVLAMPITLGSGTRLKVLEGFAARRPIVSTSKGIEGLEVADGVNVIIREDPVDIANAIIDLWKDAETRTRLCNAGFRLVGERYSWDSAADQIRNSVILGAQVQ